MLDIPALTLSLAAILLFCRACSEDSVVGAVAAGLVAGLATQTKYTAFAAIGGILLRSAQTGRWPLGLITSSLAAMIFVGWELLIARAYGQSHFLLGFLQFRAPATAKL